MNRRNFVAGLALAVLSVLGLAGPAAAGDQVPLRGRFDGTVTATPINPPLFAILVEGEGHASHLGRFTVSVPHVVDRSTRLASGTYVFTAANGDTLTADFTGQSFPTDTPGVLAIVEHATITGGTGRFAGATGGFTVERRFDTAAGTTTAAIDGTISSGGGSSRG
jgi:hypothetical protein